MKMPDDMELPSYRDTVRMEWVDYNGHLRDASYMLIFSLATDALIERIGLPAAVREARSRSIYTLEAHINYLRETREGAEVRVDMRVLGHDAKRLHLYLEMFADSRPEPAAACEQMLAHVDTRVPHSVPFDDDVAGQVHALAAAHRALPPPRYAGRLIGLPAQAPGKSART